MNMVIKSLHLQNFKGVKDETYVFDGLDSVVSGANGTGKTTIATSWLWLMADKDVALHSNPDIRPMDVEECTPRVEAVVDIDGKVVTLVKQQKRTVSKPNADGISKIALTNSYEINSVPKSERDFKQYLSDLGVNFDRFLPLSHADVFTAQKTADMRKTLFEMAKLMSDAEVAATMDDIPELTELLGNYNLEEISAMQKATLRKISEDYGKEGEILRARIEGLEAGKVDIDISALELGKADAKRRLAEIKEKLANATKLSPEQESVSEAYYKAKNRCFELDENYKRTLREGMTRNNNRQTEIKREIKSLSAEKEKRDWTMVRTKSLLESAENKLVKHNASYGEIKAQEFDEKSTYCPTCGRKYSEKRQEEIKTAFELNKAQNLKQCADTIKELNESITGYKTEITETTNQVAELNAQLSALLEEEDTLKTEMEQFRNAKTVGDTEEYQNALAEMRRLKDELDDLTNKQNEVVSALSNEEETVSAELMGYEKSLAANSVNENIDNQISELRSKQMEYEQNRADAEKILYQVSMLSKRKNELLTDDINSNFKLVKWMLFRYAKNGNYEDCCVATIDGKELGVSTNNALGIRAKVDICEGMQKYYGQNYPILLDNIEAIDTEGRKALVSDSQMIMFAVTDTALTVKEA